MNYQGYSQWVKSGGYHDITWLDAAYTALSEGRVWHWVTSRHPSRIDSTIN